MAIRGSILAVNDYLRTNDCLVSPNGQFFAIMQSDGNLCVYEGTPDNVGAFRWGWTDWSRNQDDYFTIMQSDGNLCVYWGSGPDDNRSFMWGAQSSPLGEGWYFVVMQDDGNLCVYRGTVPSVEGYVWSWMDAYSHLFRKSSSIFDAVGDAFASAGRAIAGVGSQAADRIVSVASTAGEGIHDAAGAVDGGTKAAWAATSETASGVAQGVQQAGGTFSNGFLAGAEVTKSALEAGSEVAVQGLVDMGRYVNQNACSIGVGSALTAAVTAAMASGVATVPLAALASAASQFRNDVAVKSAAGALAYVLSEPVCRIPIPGFSLPRSHVQSAIAFLITQALKGKPKPGAPAQPGFLVGVLIYGLTEFICSGKLPGGYSVWSGAQSQIPVM